MRKKWFVIAPLAILGFLLFLAAGAEVVKLLWNWLVPSIVGWRQVNFWEALGLLALCRILFGGLGRGGGPARSVRRRMSENWQSMSPEEQQRFRERMRERWGFGAS